MYAFLLYYKNHIDQVDFENDSWKNTQLEKL